MSSNNTLKNEDTADFNYSNDSNEIAIGLQNRSQRSAVLDDIQKAAADIGKQFTH